ncbi:MAG: SDR family oxidoreductase [Pseudomonadota bacterium]|nr:SDR family oxidoreductase [Pseudomonadota bacterium]
MTTETTTSAKLHQKSCVVFGATSAIAQAVASEHAKHGYALALVGRNQEKLEQIKSHLVTLGASQVSIHVQDLNAFDKHEELLQGILAEIGQYDRVLIAQGTLPEQRDIEKNYALTEQCIKDNALNTISLATSIANAMEAQKAGKIAIISSVAGDRGRQSNYIYGACKAMVTTFAAGLRNRLQASNVHVITIKPGFVDTPMTAHIPKGALWAQPEDVAQDIMSAFEKDKNIVYTPWFWRYIMLIIQHVPEFIFKKLKL